MRHWNQPNALGLKDLLVECVTFDDDGAPEQRKVTPLRDFLDAWPSVTLRGQKVSADQCAAI